MCYLLFLQVQKMQKQFLSSLTSLAISNLFHLVIQVTENHNEK